MTAGGETGAATPESIRALLAQGRGAEAEQACRTLVAARGDDDSRLLMASVLAATHGTPAATEWLRGCAGDDEAGAALLTETARLMLQAGDAAQALPLLERAARQEDAQAATHLSLGVALQTLGRLDAARDAYCAAIGRDPSLGLAHFNLGTLYKREHRFAEALDAYREAARLAPDQAPVLLALGSTLVERSEFEAGVEVLERAAAIAPADRDVLHYLGFGLLKLGRGEQAIEVIGRLQQLLPGRPGPGIPMTSALLTAGRAAEALAQVEDLRRQLPANRQLLANHAIALTECGMSQQAAALLRHDRFLWQQRIACPPGFASIEAFNAALVEHVLRHPSLDLDCNSVSCFNGQTSDELLVEPKGPVAALEQVILAAIEDYAASVAAGEPHVFVASRPPQCYLSAWVTLLRSQGHQFGHIHPTSWLSGVYYVSLPPEVKSGEAGEAGWIEFGAPPRHYRCTAEHAVTRVQPEEGLLVLFPSFYYHRTLPFESRSDRITIAFDYRGVPP